jgi:hypothetical protein
LRTCAVSPAPGDLLLEGFCLDFFYAGDAATDYMMRYATALSTIA